MRYIKVFVLVILFFLVMMFFVQNQASFADPVALKFDLFFLPPIETLPLPLYSIMLICFALGALLVLSMLMWDRMTLSARVMSSRRKLTTLEKKYVKIESELAGINTKHTAEVTGINEKYTKELDKVKTELTETEKRLDSVMRTS